MIKVPGKVLLASTLAIVSAQGFAAGSGFFVKAREPSSDVYLFTGPAWQGSQDGLPDFTFIPVEARWISSSDFEIDFRSAAMRTSDSDSDWESSDSSVSLVQGFRDRGPFRYLSVEYTEVIAESSSEFDSDLERYARVRVQGGYTLATYDISLAVEQRDAFSPGVDEAAVTTSFGIRSQVKEWNLGADVITTLRGGVKPATSLDFVAMRHFMNGHSFYGIAQTGVSGPADGWYLGVGYELRFGAF